MVIGVNQPYFPEEYFESIERLFKDTLASEKKVDFWSTAQTTSIILLVFSVLPVVPYVSWRLLRHHHFQVSRFDIVFPALWMWWLISVVIFVAAVTALTKVTNRRTEDKKKAGLSVPQMRFAFCYATIDEIRKYQTNHLSSHIAQASDYEYRLWHGLPATLTGEAAELAVVPEFIRLTEIDSLKRFSWFKVTPETQRILDAFRHLHLRVRDRIKDKKNLNNVVSCLLHLSGYLYSEIPELGGDTKGGSTSLQEWGAQQLDAFAEDVAKLQDYSSEVAQSAKSQAITKSLTSKVLSMTGVFSHDNILVCFVSWLVILAILAAFGTWMMLRTFATVRMDSVLVSMVIGTPIVGAATLVAIARQRVERKKGQSLQMADK